MQASTRSVSKVHQNQACRLARPMRLPVRAALQPFADRSSESANSEPSTSGRPQISFSSAGCVAVSSLALAAAVSLVTSEPAFADAIQQHPMEQFQLAEDQAFWSNILRYGRYFVTVMLGTGYVMMRPIAAAFKNPLSAIFAIVAVGGGAYLVKFTLEAMLGLNNDIGFDYVQGNF